MACVLLRARPGFTPARSSFRAARSAPLVQLARCDTHHGKESPRDRSEGLRAGPWTFPRAVSLPSRIPRGPRSRSSPGSSIHSPVGFQERRHAPDKNWRDAGAVAQLVRAADSQSVGPLPSRGRKTPSRGQCPLAFARPWLRADWQPIGNPRSSRAISSRGSRPVTSWASARFCSSDVHVSSSSEDRDESCSRGTEARR